MAPDALTAVNERISAELAFEALIPDEKLRRKVQRAAKGKWVKVTPEERAALAENAFCGGWMMIGASQVVLGDEFLFRL
jgi:hypothetical protein